jgi:hypothetical protein
VVCPLVEIGLTIVRQVENVPSPLGSRALTIYHPVAVSTTESRQRRAPIFASTAARIRELALAEGLGAGDRLPAERELARRLRVSRTSLREALTALRIEGIGGGPVRQRHLPASPTDRDDPADHPDLARGNPELPALSEVRNTLEALAARPTFFCFTKTNVPAAQSLSHESRSSIAASAGCTTHNLKKPSSLNKSGDVGYYCVAPGANGNRNVDIQEGSVLLHFGTLDSSIPKPNTTLTDYVTAAKIIFKELHAT